MSWDLTAQAGDSAWGSALAAQSSFKDSTAHGAGITSGDFNNDAENHKNDGGFGDFEDAGQGNNNDGACFNCGQQGHMKNDCPEPRQAGQNSGLCYNCGEPGHNKADCTNAAIPREFTGECRLCGTEGHRATDCPSAPPKICKNCSEEGHGTAECKNPRKIDRSNIPDCSPETAWAEIVAAVKDKDMDDVKAALEKYFKGIPDLIYPDLEKAFRAQDISIYIIAMEKEILETYTIMDLQGNLDKKYAVSYRFSDKPRRPKEKDGWPASPEENIKRLEDAGEPVDRGVPRCGNCDVVGHMAKACKEDKVEVTDRAEVKCFNCEKVGHRVRDCPNPRPDRFACRNCGESGHSSKECPEPMKDRPDMECRKCGEMGHSSRNCPQGGGGGSRACRNCGQEGHKAAECTNEHVDICRNCDAIGHVSRECKEPKDWSRIKCSNCQQYGHSKVRCKEPIPTDDAEGGGAGGFGGDGGFATADDNAGYGVSETTPAAYGDGGGW